MSRLGRVGLFGGTFDPIHVGHLAVATAAQEALALDHVLLLTSLVPPHRPQPFASVYHRFAMVALAVQDQPAMRASDFELMAPGPSYTAATLRRLHDRGSPPSQLFFIVGSDAFAEIATWRDYPSFLDAANFAVVTRGSERRDALAAVPREVAGRVRDVRTDPGSGNVTAVFLVCEPTPDVSSTGIRDRVSRGLPIAGLVPPTVEHHINRHDLYHLGGGQLPSATTERSTANVLHEQEHL
jgi:nicotinate-nucleotide adenylyltransferase